MLWFKKKRNQETTRLERQVSIEVQHSKTKSAKAVADTKKITDNFNRVLNQNGVTIKIHLAAGGKH